MKYPDTVEAIREYNKSQWDMAFALLKECGPPSRGSRAMSREILEHTGEEYSVYKLMEMLKVAYAWRDKR